MFLSFEMVIQSGFLYEGECAYVAGKGSFSRVDPLVDDEEVSEAEAFVAVGTHVRLLSRVNTKMFRKLARL